jgi:DNA-binding HxlR family transcriptional regulator
VPRSSSRLPRSGCPISIALERFGDPWSLLIVRDVMFKGLRTFNQFQRAGEGIASNILSDRLERLEEAGILRKQRDPADGRRFVYRLTAKGLDLAPVLIELVLWSSRYEETDAPRATVKEMRERRATVLRRVRSQWRAGPAIGD